MRSLRLQLLVSHLLLVLLLAVVMSGAIQRFFHLSQAMLGVTANNLAGEAAAGQMREALGSEQTAIPLRVLGNKDEASQVLTSGKDEFRSSLDLSERSQSGRASPTLIAETARLHNLYSIQIEDFVDNYDSRTITQNETAYRAIVPVQDSLSRTIRKLSLSNQDAIERATALARGDAQGAFITSVCVTAGALALALFLALRMVRMALTPLALLAKQAETIGGGDLTRQIDLQRSDEIGALADSFNSMAVKLADLRKSEVRRLQRAERMSDAALESLYDPVIVTDARARIVHLNSAAQAIFGPAPDSPRIEVERHVPDRQIVNAIHRAVQQEAVSAEEGESAMIPVTVGGVKRTYRLRATPMFTEESLLLGSVTVLEDITYLKEIDRVKNAFIGVASHELRTPVTSLLLSVQLLQEGAAGPLTDAQRELVSAQQEDLERLERLMRELLDISRLESGTMAPRLEIVPAAELVAQARHTMASEASKRHVKLLMDEHLAYCSVKADRSQIARVLINLIDNAIKHSKSRGRIVLRAVERKDDVLFSVEDTGAGIPQEYLTKIFDRFVQVPGATQSGAGLGLSIAQTIVRLHGGEMTVTSKVGEGSTFRFNLYKAEARAGSDG